MAAAAAVASTAAAAKTKSEVKHVRSLRAAHRLPGLLAVGLVHRLADAARSWGSAVCGCCGHSDWLWLPPLAWFLRAAPLVCLSARFGPIITLACCRHISHFLVRGRQMMKMIIFGFVLVLCLALAWPQPESEPEPEPWPGLALG